MKNSYFSSARGQSFIDTSTTDTKLIFQLLHVYDIHKCLNIRKQVYL